jgi:hypothetical protein
MRIIDMDGAIFHGDKEKPTIFDRPASRSGDDFVHPRPQRLRGESFLVEFRRQLLGQMRKLGAVSFPILPVEWGDRDCLYRARVEAAHVDAVTIGIRARHVEGFNPANFTEQMSGDTGIEHVGREGVGALQQFESRLRHDEMKKARLAADRAVALIRFDLRGREDFESHTPAVATAEMLDPITVHTDFTLL